MKGEGKISQRELLEKMAKGEVKVVGLDGISPLSEHLSEIVPAELLAEKVYQQIDLDKPEREQKPRHPAEKGIRRKWWNER